jgi:hypothetical protein
MPLSFSYLSWSFVVVVVGHCESRVVGSWQSRSSDVFVVLLPYIRKDTRQRQIGKWQTAFKYPVGQSPPPLFNKRGITATAKWKKATAIQKRRPLTVFASQTILSRKGRGKEENGIEGFCASASLHAQ